MTRHTTGPRFGFIARPQPAPAAMSGDALVREYGNIVDGALRRLPRAGRLSAVTDLDDLRQEGLIALVHAAQAFDASRGVPFPGFARRCVENALVTAMRKGDVLPESVRRDARTLRAVEEQHRRSAEALSVFELAHYSGLTEDRVREVQEWLAREQSVDIDDAGTRAGAHGSYSDATTVTPEEALLVEEDTRAIAKALAGMPERSRRILLARVVHKSSVRAIAAQEGLSPARVSQICSETTRDLISLMD